MPKSAEHKLIHLDNPIGDVTIIPEVVLTVTICPRGAMPENSSVSLQIANRFAGSYGVHSAAFSDKPEWLYLGLCVISGALLGLSCPGFGCWLLAWIALSPLLLAIFCSIRKRQAFWRGTAFGFAYNLVYLHWLISTQNFAWTGLARQIPELMSFGSWIVFSAQQALIIGVFALVARCVPLVSGLLPLKAGAKVYCPALLTLPLLWVLIVNRIGNAGCLLGVPWSMLEYSQYKQLPLLQLCPYIGGIGLESVIVLANVVIAALAISLLVQYGKCNVSTEYRLTGPVAALRDCGVMVILLAGLWIYGSSKLNQAAQPLRTVTVSVLQGNINPLKTPISGRKAVSDMVHMACRAPAGLCVWTEWSVPCPFSKKPDVFQGLARVARDKKQDWLVGAFDENAQGQSFNVVCALSARGSVLSRTYAKRFLVPVGEYLPQWVKATPLKALFNDEWDVDFTSGNQATVFKLEDKIVAPIICFESISPEIVSESVRAGGEIITNLSNTMWFASPALSEQMLAMSVFRAAESSRSFVYATNTGPSAMIDPFGRIKLLAPSNQAALLVETMPLCNTVTPFSRWYR